MTSKYTTPLSLTALLTATDCAVKLDSYRGCSLMCNYCYSFSRKSQHETVGLTESKYFSNVTPCDPSYVANLLAKVWTGKKSKDPAVLSLRRYPVFQWGVLADPLPYGPELKFRTTKRLLELMPTVWPKGYFSFTTKSAKLVTSDEYIERLLPLRDRIVVLISCSAVDKRIDAAEPLAPTTQSRLEAIAHLSSLGFLVIPRIEPFYPSLMKEHLKAIELFAKAGAKGVIAGAIHLESRPEQNVKAMYAQLDKALGFSIQKELKGLDFVQAGTYTYPLEMILKFHQVMRTVAHDNGLYYFTADTLSRMMSDRSNVFGFDLLGAPKPANSVSIVDRAYESPDDFGLHQMNLNGPLFQQDGIRLWQSTQKYRAELLSKGIKTIGDRLKWWYRDPGWVTGLVPYAKASNIDQDGNIHYKVDSRFIDFCVRGRKIC